LTHNSDLDTVWKVHILSDIPAMKRDSILGLMGLGVDEEGKCTEKQGKQASTSKHFSLFVYEGQSVQSKDLRQLPLRRADAFLVIADDLEDDEPAECSGA